MKNILTIIGWILAIVFCVLFITKCDKINRVGVTIYKSVHDTARIKIVDTIQSPPITIYKPIYKVGETKYIKGDTVYYPTKSMYLSTGDTLEIVQRYLMTNIYTGGFSKDSVHITWQDSVSQNKSLGHKFTIQNMRPTKIAETHKRKLYLGGSVGWSMETRLPAVTPTAFYADKQERAFILSYDIINKTTQFGILAKIHL